MNASVSQSVSAGGRGGGASYSRQGQPAGLPHGLDSGLPPNSSPTLAPHRTTRTDGPEAALQQDDETRVSVPGEPHTMKPAAPATSSRSAEAEPTVEKEEEEDEQEDAESYERMHVHGVYDAIAPHFSATRHKPWPFVATFLAAQPPGSLGLDVGCGNGKYLAVNRDLFVLGSDRSAALVALARRHGQQQQQQLGPDDDEQRQRNFPRDGKKKPTGAPSADSSRGESGAEGPAQARLGAGTEVLVADGLSLPFRHHAADFAICIAVIHHMSTRERRQDAIRQLLLCVRPPKQESPQASTTTTNSDTGSENSSPLAASAGASGGKVLIYVWALEQGTSRRGWDEGGEQDLLVPWVMKSQEPPGDKRTKKQKQKQQQQQQRRKPRGKGDGDALAPPASSTAAPATDTTGGSGEALLPPAKSPTTAAAVAAVDEEIGPTGPVSAGGEDGPAAKADKVFHRYYHLYRKGELEEDVVAAGGQVLRSGYERDNWWVIAGPSLPP